MLPLIFFFFFLYLYFELLFFLDSDYLICINHSTQMCRRSVPVVLECSMIEVVYNVQTHCPDVPSECRFVLVCSFFYAKTSAFVSYFTQPQWFWFLIAISNVSFANYFFHFPLMKVEGSTETLGLFKNIVHIFIQF